MITNPSVETDPFLWALQVLDTVLHADRVLLSQLPCFQNAAVVVHLTSHIKVSTTPSEMLGMCVCAVSREV